jgi:hypothetical protein
VWDESLSLRELAVIGNEYRGYQVTAVRANTRSNSPAQTVATLVSDGLVFAEQINPGSQIYLVPQYKVTLGEIVNDVTLNIEGGTFIHDIQVDLKFDESKVITIRLNGRFNNNEVIDLSRYAQMRRHAGALLDQVFVKASTAVGGSVLVSVNNTNLGQLEFAAGYTDEQSVWPKADTVLGANFWSTSLYTYGDLVIEDVMIILR